ncbi:hypothetical protein TPENAI_60264 [Tenacibaculum litopenaei]
MLGMIKLFYVFVNKDSQIQMNKTELKNIIVTKKTNGKFTCDEIGMTWQVSYVRFVVGEKVDFDSLEHFYWSILNSENNVSSGYVGELEWIDRVNISEWISHLKIESVEKHLLDEEVKSTLKEIDREEDNREEFERINKANLKIPEGVAECWMIEESKESRHPVGATWSIIAEYMDDFFYIERHWES